MSKEKRTQSAGGRKKFGDQLGADTSEQVQVRGEKEGQPQSGLRALSKRGIFLGKKKAPGTLPREKRSRFEETPLPALT